MKNTIQNKHKVNYLDALNRTNYEKENEENKIKLFLMSLFGLKKTKTVLILFLFSFLNLNTFGQSANIPRWLNQTKNPMFKETMTLAGVFAYGIPNQATTLQLVRQRGFNRARVDMNWYDVENQGSGGTYDFTEKKAVRDILVNSGLQDPIYILDYNNKIYRSPPTINGGEAGITTQANRTAFANYAKAAVQYFSITNNIKGMIWEIWNEQDETRFWYDENNVPTNNAKPSDYVALVQETVAAIRSVDPNAYIICGGFARPYIKFPQFLKNCIAGGLCQGLDGLAIHSYEYMDAFNINPGSVHPGRLENQEISHDTIRQWMTRYNNGKVIPIVDTEFGIDANQASWLNNGWGTSKDDARAKYYIRHYLDQYYGKVFMSSLYSLNAGGAEAIFNISDGTLPMSKATTYARNLLGDLRGTNLNYGDIDKTHAINFKPDNCTTGANQIIALWSTSLTQQITFPTPITIKEIRDVYGNSLGGAQTLSNYTLNEKTTGPVYLVLDCSIPITPGTNSIDYICKTKMAPVIDGLVENSWSAISPYTIGNLISGTASSAADLSASFKATWDNTAVYFLVDVKDDSLKYDSGTSPWDDDAVEVFIDGNNDKAITYDANDHQFTFRWSDNSVYSYQNGTLVTTNPAGVSFAQQTIAGGYRMEIKILWSSIGAVAANNKLIGFDMHVNDDDNGGTRDAKITRIGTADNASVRTDVFGVLKLSSESCFYPACTSTSAPIIDGIVDASWSKVSADSLNTVIGVVKSLSDLSATYKMNWDNTNIYFLVDVKDDTLKNDSGTAPWDDDAVEVFIDGKNEKTSTYDTNDHQFLFRINDNTIYSYQNGASVGTPAGVVFSQGTLAGGYRMEIKISWAAIGIPLPSAGSLLGLDIHVDDDDNGGTRDSKKTWKDPTDNASKNPSLFGIIALDQNACDPLATGISNSIEQSKIEIFPNPVTSSATLSIDATLGKYQISIYNTVGQIVYSKLIDKTGTEKIEVNIPINQLSPGMYLINVIGENNILRTRIIKE